MNDLAMFTSDWHIGVHDPRALTTIFEVVSDLQPRVIVLGGDILDCAELHKTRFGSPAPVTELSLVQEIEITKRLFSDLRKRAPDAEIVYLEGNHEARLLRQAERAAPRLVKFLPSWRDLLGLDALGIKWFPYRYPYFLDEVVMVHGTKSTMNAAKLEMQKWHRPYIQGHSHREKIYQAMSPGGVEIWGIEAGHAREAQGVEWTPDPTPDWQQGFVLLRRAHHEWAPFLARITGKGGTESCAVALPHALITTDRRDRDRLWRPIREALKADILAEYEALIDHRRNGRV